MDPVLDPLGERACALFYDEGLSFTEIARRLGVARDVVPALIVRGERLKLEGTPCRS